MLCKVNTVKVLVSVSASPNVAAVAVQQKLRKFTRSTSLSNGQKLLLQHVNQTIFSGTIWGLEVNLDSSE